MFPFEDATFDVVFSSNALEHIVDLAQIYRESSRVLKSGGYCVHVMPSTAWRVWTAVTQYIELFQRVGSLAPALFPRSLTFQEPVRMARSLMEIGRWCVRYAVPRRHGESGNAFTELWTFRRDYWIKHFREHSFEVICAEPMGLFYTGHMVLGKRWSLDSRRRVATLLGSACVVYKVRPLIPALARGIAVGG